MYYAWGKTCQTNRSNSTFLGVRILSYYVASCVEQSFENHENDKMHTLWAMWIAQSRHWGTYRFCKMKANSPHQSMLEAKRVDKIDPAHAESTCPPGACPAPERRKRLSSFTWDTSGGHLRAEGDGRSFFRQPAYPFFHPIFVNV